MYQSETNEKLKCDKLLLKLHLKYILGISLACICLVVIFSFCEDSVFKSCISVSSTVTSIILSVIAIILSVTGERTTNEIRNKVSDSVNQLEDCTSKSSELTSELSTTLQQLNILYANMNEKIGTQIPQIQSTLNDLVLKNGDINNEEENKDNPIDHIVSFLNVIKPNTKNYLKKAYIYLEEKGKKHPINIGSVAQYLMDDEGAEGNTAILVVGLMLGILCTGALTHDNNMHELIDRL